jgi:DnaJ like chaperone protein
MEMQQYTDRAAYERARAAFETKTSGYFAAYFAWELAMVKARKRAYFLYGGWGVIAFLVGSNLMGDNPFPLLVTLYFLVGPAIALWWFDKAVLENLRVAAFTRDHPRPKFSAVKPVWKSDEAETAAGQTRRDERAQSRPAEPNLGRPETPPERSARILRLTGKITKRKIKKHYHALLMRYHPDKAAMLGPEVKEIAERKTKELNEAYEVLEKYYGL